MTLHELFIDFFGDLDYFDNQKTYWNSFKNPSTPSDLFGKGWKIERLQTYAAKMRDAALNSDDRNMYQNLVVELEEERLRGYEQAKKSL